MAFTPADPLYNEIDATNLESVRKNVVFNNLFVDTPFQAKLRRAGVWDEFLGGAGMMGGMLPIWRATKRSTTRKRIEIPNIKCQVMRDPRVALPLGNKSCSSTHAYTAMSSRSISQ